MRAGICVSPNRRAVPHHNGVTLNSPERPPPVGWRVGQGLGFACSATRRGPVSEVPRTPQLGALFADACPPLSDLSPGRPFSARGC